MKRDMPIRSLMGRSRGQTSPVAQPSPSGETDNSQIPAPRELSRTLSAIYNSAGYHLGLKQRLTSVWRPLYAPFDELLRWIPERCALLDIGCGSGAFVFLANRVRHAAPAFGIDINVSAIELAQVVNNNSDNIHFRVGLKPDLATAAAVSVITLIDVLHHVPRDSQKPLLLQLAQSLAAGGRIVVKDLDPRPAWRAIANRITDYLSTRSTVAYISQTEVEALLRCAGFQLRVSKRLHQHVWSHYIVVGDKPI